MMGRHRRSPRRHLAFVGGAAATVFVLLTAGALGVRAWTRTTCSTPVRVAVTAAAEITPAIRSAADAWVKTPSARIGRRCVEVSVSTADSADVAASLAASRGGSLVGASGSPASVARPDVWIPDSSLWLHRVRAAAAGAVPATATSIARSPVVMAVSDTVAIRMGWPNSKFSWADLNPAAGSGSPVTLGIADPVRDASGLAGLLSLAAPTAPGSGAGASASPSPGTGGSGARRPDEAATARSVSVLRALARGIALDRADLLERLSNASDGQATTDPQAGSGARAPVTVAPLPEYVLATQTSRGGQRRVVGLPVSPSPPALDYPYAVLPTTTGATAAAAELLATALMGYDFRDRLARSGLRARDGSVGAGFSRQAVPGIDPAAQPPVPESTDVNRILSTWGALTASSRMLAVLDISGSMMQAVPTAGGATRMAVTVDAAKRGLSLFDDGWAVGLWVFSTELAGDRDYRELVPLGPLSRQRADLSRALDGVAPRAGGATGLYDTVLAGYERVLADWDPGRSNSLVVLTDGENEDRNGLNLDQLLAQLRTRVDQSRPVQVILIGIGADSGEAAMRQITAVTGGGVFIARDPATIGEIFLEAIALRATRLGGR